MEEKRLALLIDAENTSSKYIDAIISELKKYGVITYQRMYGDFTNSALADWHKKALNHAIVPIQQPRYSSGKNASDIMLVIDAMDILYQDDHILVCIKPARVLSTDEPGGLPDLLRQALKDPKADIRTVHRLDRVVSGVMVLARNACAASELSRQVRENAFSRT